MTGDGDLSRASVTLLARGAKLVLVTLGPAGCYYRCASGERLLSTYNTRVVDTTGAGDAFLGAALFRLAKSAKPLEELGLAELDEIADFANAAGALCATRKGAIPAMPTLAEIERCRRETPRLHVRRDA